MLESGGPAARRGAPFQREGDRMERDRTRRETLDDDTLSLFCSQLSLMLQAGIGVEEGA